jgi:hypothetical protein
MPRFPIYPENEIPFFSFEDRPDVKPAGYVIAPDGSKLIDAAESEDSGKVLMVPAPLTVLGFRHLDATEAFRAANFGENDLSWVPATAVGGQSEAEKPAQATPARHQLRLIGELKRTRDELRELVRRAAERFEESPHLTFVPEWAKGVEAACRRVDDLIRIGESPLPVAAHRPMSLSAAFKGWHCDAEYEPHPEWASTIIIWEPLDVEAPEDARPYIHGIYSVDFYDRTGNMMIAKDVRRHDLNSSFPTLLLMSDGCWYEAGYSRCVYRDDRWWMKHYARKNTRAAAVLNAGWSEWRK